MRLKEAAKSLWAFLGFGPRRDPLAEAAPKLEALGRQIAVEIEGYCTHSSAYSAGTLLCEKCRFADTRARLQHVEAENLRLRHETSIYGIEDLKALKTLAEAGMGHAEAEAARWFAVAVTTAWELEATKDELFHLDCWSKDHALRTDESMDRMACDLVDRDEEVAALRAELAALRAEHVVVATPEEFPGESEIDAVVSDEHVVDTRDLTTVQLEALRGIVMDTATAVGIDPTNLSLVGVIDSLGLGYVQAARAKETEAKLKSEISALTVKLSDWKEFADRVHSKTCGKYTEPKAWDCCSGVRLIDNSRKFDGIEDALEGLLRFKQESDRIVIETKTDEGVSVMEVDAEKLTGLDQTALRHELDFNNAIRFFKRKTS